MRALRVVGITGEDGNVTVILEDPDRRERFTVPGDETLRAAARGDLARLGQIAIEVGNELRPREIQARIRAGASVAELAALAGVSEQKIERFAYPVLLERSRTAELARLAHPVRSGGPDPRTLGEVVADTFDLRGQNYADAVWDSWKGEDGRWVVTLAWTAGRSDNRAHWTFQPGASGGTVTALDEHASDLVEGLPARPLRTIGEVIDLARSDEAPAEVVAEAPRRAEPRGEVAPAWIERRRAEHVEPRRAEPAEPRRTEHVEPRRTEHVEPRRAEPAEPRRTEPVEPRRTEHVEPRRTEHVEPRRGEPAEPERREAAEHRWTEPAAERQVEPRRGDEHRARPADPPRPDNRTGYRSDQERPDHQRTEPARTEEPDEAPGERPAASETARPAAAAPAEEPAAPAPRRTRKGKPVMPSWDEVLLGVKGQR